jgi:hypothetical protein
MVNKCQECGSEVALGSRFCGICGVPLETGDPVKGGNLIRVAFVFACLFPAVVVLIELVLMMMSGKYSLFMIFDFLIVMSTLILFAFVYRGHQWAVTTLGLVLVITNLVEIVAIFTMLSISNITFAVGFIRVLWIAFGIYLNRSSDVFAFVKAREQQRVEPKHLSNIL